MTAVAITMSQAEADTHYRSATVRIGAPICITERAVFQLIQGAEIAANHNPTTSDMPAGCYVNEVVQEVRVADYMPGKPWTKIRLGDSDVFTLSPSLIIVK